MFVVMFDCDESQTTHHRPQIDSFSGDPAKVTIWGESAVRQLQLGSSFETSPDRIQTERAGRSFNIWLHAVARCIHPCSERETQARHFFLRNTINDPSPEVGNFD